MTRACGCEEGQVPVPSRQLMPLFSLLFHPEENKSTIEAISGVIMSAFAFHGGGHSQSQSTRVFLSTSNATPLRTTVPP
jgi:hypothetical protein